jgi:hypothetical protein
MSGIFQIDWVSVAISRGKATVFVSRSRGDQLKIRLGRMVRWEISKIERLWRRACKDRMDITRLSLGNDGKL